MHAADSERYQTIYARNDGAVAMQATFTLRAEG